MQNGSLESSEFSHNAKYCNFKRFYTKFVLALMQCRTYYTVLNSYQMVQKNHFTVVERDIILFSS